jgi:hypothetical protein
VMKVIGGVDVGHHVCKFLQDYLCRHGMDWR